MNPVREQIVKEALEWERTPYHDHAGIKHVGVDCAFFPLRVYQAVGRVPKDFVVPDYSPQQWLNSPSQKDKYSLRVEDTTFLDIVLQFARREITEAEILPGDFVIYKVAASWTHGGIVIRWPDYMLHPIKELGVVGSHGTKEGFLTNRQRRFFSVLDKEEE